MATDVSTEI